MGSRGIRHKSHAVPGPAGDAVAHERRDLLAVEAREHRIGPHESVFAPRGIPHAQRRVVPGEGRLLVMVVPGGFEGFFRGLAEADAAGELGPKAYAEVSAKYGITWL